MEHEQKILIKSRSLARAYDQSRWENLDVVTSQVRNNHNDELGGTTDVAEVARHMYRSKVHRVAHQCSDSVHYAQQNTQLVLSNRLNVNSGGELELRVPLINLNDQKGGTL